jgi:membrane protease YdiL (CAAX protease family)
MSSAITSEAIPWNTTQEENQYSLAKILGIWVAAALPMGILSWVVYPALASDIETNPLGAGFTRVGLMTVGLIWVFVLALIIVYREEGDLRWVTVRRRLWLNTPRDPKTGEPRRKLWLWLIPIIILLTVVSMMIGPFLDRLWITIMPFFTPPPGSDASEYLGTAELQAQLVGAWDFMLLFLVMAFFNIIGEEFLFRGVLLPKMVGTFDKWDWVANGVLMGAYHWHQPWTIPGAIVANALFFALPARFFRSTWMAMIAHSMQYLLSIPIILAVVLGLAKKEFL